MKRAKERGLQDVYLAAFDRLYELAGADLSDPLHRDWWRSLAVYEQMLTEKNGRNQKAGRTRQKIKNKGIEQSLIEWVKMKGASDGFKMLIDQGRPEYTGEYLVIKYADRFPKDIVAKAKVVFSSHGYNYD
jgi:hypothetical protein